MISVDGVGAFDSVSRAMLSGLLDMEEGKQLLPFVLMFYSQPSSYLFDDEAGETHTVQQGGRGARWRTDALVVRFGATAGTQSDRRRVACRRTFVRVLGRFVRLARVAAIHRLMRVELWRHSKISVHHGKTKLWNKAGVLPSGVEELQQLASSVDEGSGLERKNSVTDFQARN